MTSSNKGASAPVSFASLSVATSSTVPCKVPYKPGGKDLGVFLHVLGSQSSVVQAAINAHLNRQRSAAIARAAAGNTDLEFTPVETEEESNRRLVAVRLVGWDGIDQPYSPELAYQLVKENPDIFKLVLTTANETSNFLKPSRVS